MTRTFDRRSFLRTAAGLSAATLLTPETILADPYRPFGRVLRPFDRRAASTPVRVRGRVRTGTRGVAGVRITDGLSVVRTDAEGYYDLVTDRSRSFVSCSLPSGYRIGRNDTGTARFYRPLAATPGSEIDAVFDVVPLEGSDDRHAMLLVPDVQTQSAWEMERFHEQSVPDLQQTVRDLGDTHVFGVACGDIMYDDLSLYPEYERAVSRIGVPFFQVVGNHDLDFSAGSDEASTDTFSRHFGPRHYSFDRGAVRYVVLDDVFYHGTGYIGYVQDEQLRWLEADLADREPGSPVVVAMHIPIQGTRYTREGMDSPTLGGSVTNREALYRLLEPFDAHVVCGHTHENDHNWRGGVHEHVSGTVCGAWWSGPICGDGTPNGYSVYEAFGEEVRWRYKSTGQPAHHQMRAYLPGADPQSPQELVANVWDADDGWTVVWYEDGERKGRMARRIGRDPLSRRIHSGDAAPPRRPWVDPYPRFLHYAPVSPGVKEIRVEATDRAGRKYMGVAGPIPEGMTAWERESAAEPVR